MTSLLCLLSMRNFSGKQVVMIYHCYTEDSVQTLDQVLDIYRYCFVTYLNQLTTTFAQKLSTLTIEKISSV